MTYSFLVWVNIHYLASNVLSFAVAVIFAYITNKRWVFRTAATNKVDYQEFLRFVGSRISTLVLESVILFIFITRLDCNQYGVKIIANIIIITSNYFLSELIVFRKKKTIKGV